MPTVCIDCRYLGPRPSGIAEVVRALIDHVPALAPELEFLLLRNPAFPGRLSEARNVRELPVRWAANGPATMWWLSRVVDLHGVDLFHATFNTLPAGLAMPSIVTVHDVMRLTHPQWTRGWSAPIARRFYAAGLRRALAHADALACVSAATASLIAHHAPAAAARTHVTRSGVATRFRPRATDPAALARLGLHPGRRFVLTVGQGAPYKNHTGALLGFAAAFAETPGIDLVFVQRQRRGAGALAGLAQRLGIADRVHFLPVMDDAALHRLYTGAAALLHPSFVEGFGNPVAEAMAAGCPVVTSDRSAMIEVAGDAAQLVDPTDPTSIAAGLRAVVLDPLALRALRTAGLARAAELRWSDFAAANVALYRGLLSGR